MSPLEGMVYGFSIVLTPSNLIAVMLGALLGTMVGVLPGIGPTGAIAILLTTTLTLRPETALIMLAGIFYGSMYGGSTTSILVNVPGEAASVVTCIDGYQMAKKGRAGLPWLWRPWAPSWPAASASWASHCSLRR